MKQHGSALIVCLLILVIMTLIGITAIGTTTMQERMAGNARDVSLAFQSAEAGLREAEEFLQSAVLPPFNGTNGLYPVSTTIPALWDQIDWEADARLYDVDLEAVSQPARFIIEEMPATGGGIQSLASDEPVTESGMYRITARGVGGSDVAIVILQSTYRR